MSNDDNGAASAFGKVNLMDLEDRGKAYSGDFEARFARKALNFEHLGVSYIRFAPGARAPFGHSHKGQEEAYIVLSGSGSIKLGDETLELAKWDVVRIAPSTPRGVSAGDDGLDLIAIGSDAPADGDGVAHQEFWDE